MNDITRWLVLDIIACKAGIASHEAQAARYEADAAKLELSQERFMRHAAEAEVARLTTALHLIDAARANAQASHENARQPTKHASG